MKRYTDTGKWTDKWYRQLPMRYKLAYQYVLDNCSPVGIWEPDEELVNFMVGTNKGEWIALDEFYTLLGDRVLTTERGYWWLTKFCGYQYGNLPARSASKPIQSYIKQLKDHNLWQAYVKGTGTLKDKDKEKEKEKEIGSDTDGYYAGNLDKDHAIANRSEAFMQEVLGYRDKYSMDMLTEFIAYWSEPNRSNTKMRCELQPTWDTARRLATWKRKNKQFGRVGRDRNDSEYLKT